MSRKIDAICNVCGSDYKARLSDVKRGYGKYCSRKCSAMQGAINSGKIDRNGENNPNWKGGISTNNYRYKLIQKDRYPERIEAREITRKAIRSGKIERKPCEVCGSTDNIHAHHDDYSKPLDIRWLCRKHHRKIHGGLH